MFSSNTAEVISFKQKEKPQDLFTKILLVYKQLKQAAQLESISRPKFNVANLRPEQVKDVKSLENKLGICLVAYKDDIEIDENKAMILNRISSLFDEYLSLCTKKKNKPEDFNDFFKQ